MGGVVVRTPLVTLRNNAMKFKVKFLQDVAYRETCEAVVEAETRDQALEEIFKRNFTHYLVVQRTGDPPKLIEEYFLELSQVD